MVKLGLTKADILRGKTRVDLLFKDGSSFITYPYRVVYRVTPNRDSDVPLSALVTVSKRYFKRAVKRNLIRRRIKEAYRLQRPSLAEWLEKNQLQIDLAILYLDKKEPDYLQVEKRMSDLISHLCKELSDKELLFNFPEKNNSFLSAPCEK